MKFLRKYNVFIVPVAWLTVILQIALEHLAGDVICNAGQPYPHPVADDPEVLAPVMLAQFRILGVNTTLIPTFQALDQFTDRQRWKVFDMDMHMVFIDYAFQNTNVLCVAELLKQLRHRMNITLRHRVINVYRQLGNRVTAKSLLFAHSVNVEIWIAIENLALKAYSTN